MYGINWIITCIRGPKPEPAARQAKMPAGESEKQQLAPKRGAAVRLNGRHGSTIDGRCYLARDESVACFP